MLRNITLILSLIVTVFAQVGCAQLVALPIMVLMLPIQLIKMVFSLIPVIAKYAPYALMFVESGDNINLDSHSTDLKIVSHNESDRFDCYRIDFVNRSESERQSIATSIVSAIESNSTVRVFFASYERDVSAQSDYNQIYDDMIRAEIQSAYDSNLRLDDNSTSI